MKRKTIAPKYGFTVLGGALITCLLLAEYAAAQIEEVIVTARKRAETLQEVPVSVSAIAGDTFEQFGGLVLRNVAEMTPNLTAARGSVSQQIAIRGLGNSISNGGFNSAVGLGIDGLFFSQLPWLEVGMFDLRQVEVLRGPQGTYFGKNTTAGLINMVSRSPTESWEGHVTVGYETELEAYRIEGAVGGPIGDALSVRLAAQHLEDDGWMQNLTNGDPVEAMDRDIFKLGLEWNANDRFSVSAKTSYGDWDVDGNGTQVGNCGPGNGATVLSFDPYIADMIEDCEVDDGKTGGVQRAPFDRDIQAFVDAGGTALNGLGLPYGSRAGVLDERNDYRKIESFSQSLALRWEIDEDSRLISVTGYGDLELDYLVDSDFADSPITQLGASPEAIRIGFGPLFGFQNIEDYEQITQELRFESSVGNLDYTVGAYYEDHDADLRDLTDFSIDMFFAFMSRDKGSTFERESWALFGEAAWHLSEEWHLVLGGRYTEEDFDATTYSEIGSLGDPHDDDPLAQAIFSAFGLTEFQLGNDRGTDHFAPSAVVQWDATDEAILYFSYKEGFKAGGFDGSVSGPASIPFYEFDDEEVTSFELGAKWESNDLRVNLAIFYSEYDDLQVQVFDGIAATVTRNAAEATTRGFELDALWVPVESLTASLALGYTDAEYDSFPNAPCYVLQTEAGGCLNGEQNLDGDDLPFAPEWSANLGLNWRRALGGGLVLDLGIAVNYRDEMWLAANLDPDSLEDDLTLLNANASLSGSGNRWTAAFIGRNLTDEEYRTQLGDVPFFDAHQVRLGLPATYEFQFTYRFF